MILIDTHVLIWLDEGAGSLGVKSLAIIDQAMQEGKLTISAISFWEVAMLVQKKRVQIKMDLEAWRLNLLEQGLIEIPIHGTIALRAGQLRDFHGDPADRIIVATALESSATLITADEKILTWTKPLRTFDARG
jgi:PIN domain nuclease of toxin-antitoxin system